MNALFCTVSILSVRWLFRLVCHTGHAYSRTGLITLTYMVTALFNLYNMYTLFPAFATIFSTCLFHVKSLEMVTPRSLAYFTSSISFPSIINLGTVLLRSGCCIKLISISFDLSELIFMSLCSVHLAAMSTECCRTDSLVLWHISNSVLSSTYLYNGAGVSRSFIYSRKHLGPSNVPCGRLRAGESYRVAAP